MSWKKMIIGEKMPDKDDPKYHERYEKEVEAGRRFAKATKIDRVAVSVQQFANNHKKTFLGLVFGFVILCFGANLYRMCRVYSCHKESRPATEIQEELVRNRHKKLHESVASQRKQPSEIQKKTK